MLNYLMSTLLILDGNALIHRAYHSVPKNLTYNGTTVNALYGFYSILLNALDVVQPKYLAICLDPPGPVFRNQEYLAYRTQRKPADKELKDQFPLIKKSLQDAGFPIFSVGGYEADDAIATIAKRSLKRRFKQNKNPIVKKIFIMTGDRDLMQLVNQNVSLLMPGRALSDLSPTGLLEVKSRLGVDPSQVVDYKALVGDSSDNYPGVPGIGPVAAISLLDSFSTLDNIYKNLKNIKPALQEKLEINKENAYLSQKLAKLVTDVPLQFQLKKLKVTPITKQNLDKVFQTFGFKSLSTRLHKHNPILSANIQPASKQESLF